jgi:hypothetical protein
MNQPIDLRELLREARKLIQKLPGHTAHSLWARIDAALAQTQDAKPVAWIDPSKQQAFITEEFKGVLRTWANARVVKPDIDLYIAPQPPAGKGEPAASGRIRAWIRGAMQPSTPHGPAEYNEECVPGEDQPESEGWMPLYFVSPDAIPREIHERGG